MKKYLLVVLSLACGMLAASTASAANLSPYQYTPKQPPVEVDLGVLDEAEAAPPAQPAPAPAAEAESTAAPKPLVLIPPAAEPAPEAAAAPAAELSATESAPANSTEALLDSVMKHHLPAEAKKKPVKLRKAVKPAPKPAEPAPAAAVETPKAEEKTSEPALAVAAPKAEEKTAEEAQPAVAEPAPAPAPEAPKAEEKAAEPAPAPEEAKPAEEKPKGPVVRERRRKSAADEAPAALPAETAAVAFAAGSSELTPEAWQALDAFVAKIKDMPDQRLQILGYAAGDGSESDARRMALSRALMVRSYLIDKGIGAARLDVRALGMAEGKADQAEVVFAK